MRLIRINRFGVLRMVRSKIMRGGIYMLSWRRRKVILLSGGVLLSKDIDK